jgi:UDP-2,3-diacylglucosamine pyrophosphatase LpxH
MQCDTLIVSDVHLGSPLAMARELHHLLSTSTFNRLILLGDIFSDLNFRRLTSEHWKVISLIRKLSNPKRNVEVVWVEGNHDADLTQVMEHLIGVKVFQQYEWVWNGKKCIAMHGHQFDGLFATGNPWFNSIVTEIHLWLQKKNILKRWLPRILDRLHTKYQRLTFKVAEGALNAAKELKADYVFCGHTHDPYHEFRDGVEYWNSGCWVGDAASFLALGLPENSVKTGIVERAPNPVL